MGTDDRRQRTEDRRQRRILSLASRPSLLVVCSLFLIAFFCGFSPISALKNEQGNRYYKKGELGRAKSAYLSALASDPKSPEIAFNLGNAYYREAAFKESIARYENAARAEKTPALQSKAFYNLGNSLFRAEDKAKAAEFYKQALRLNPKDEDAKYNLELLTKQSQNPKNQKQNQQNKNQNPGGQGQQGNSQQQQNQASENKEKGGQEQRDQQSKGGQSQKEKKDQESKQSSGATEGKKDEQNKDKTSGDAESAAAAQQEKRKSDAERRTDQILNALENQEQQALRLENNNKNQLRKVQRYVEKDW